MEKESKNRKVRHTKHGDLDDQEFLLALRVTGGLFARTAEYIRDTWGIQYTRAAVANRASNFIGEVADIREETLDIAEGGLHDLMLSANESVRLKAIELYLKTQGRRRGYIEKIETETTRRTEKIILQLRPDAVTNLSPKKEEEPIENAIVIKPNDN